MIKFIIYFEKSSIDRKFMKIKIITRNKKMIKRFKIYIAIKEKNNIL